MKSLVAGLAMAVLSFSAAAQTEDVERRIRDVAGLEVSELKAFITKLKHAANVGDKQAAAQLMCYPLRADVKSKKRISEREFIQHYDTVMNPRVLAAIKGQKFEDLSVNWQGVMFGNGEVWIGGKVNAKTGATRICVITVNN